MRRFHQAKKLINQSSKYSTQVIYTIFRTVDTRKKEQKSIIIYELQELHFMFYVCECAVSKVLQEPILVSEHHHVDK